MLVIGLGFGASVAGLAPAYVAAAKAISGGLQALATAALPFARSFQFLTGPVDRLDTVGGYLSYKIFPDIALLIAIYAAIQGAQVLRGSEGKGIYDLWFAAGRSRNAILRDRVAGFVIALTGIVALLFVFTVIGGALSGVQFPLQALGQCVAVGFVGLVSFSLGLLVSQFVQAARTASGVTAGYLVASFFVANMFDHLGALTFLRYLSPFYYYLSARTLAGTSFDVASMVTLVIASLVAGAVAWWLYLRRDIGGVSLARVHHSRPADFTFRPSAIWHRTLWLNWIAEQPIGIAAWVFAIAAFTATEAAVVPAAIRIVNDSGGTFEKFLERHGGLLSAGQYLSFFLTFTAFLVAGFVVAQVARWASDATQHRNDVVLAQSVSMGRLLLERTATVLVLAALIGLAVVAGTFVGSRIGGYTVDGAGLLRTFLDVVLLSFAIGGVGLLAVTVLRSAAATGVTGGLLIACFLLTTVAGLLSWPGWASRASVFDAFGTPYLSVPRTGSLIYLVVLGAGGTFVAYLAMRRGMRIVA
ncbi:MAG TPA: ABC transporter permease subunit [Candidatus Dormibacteraeota bacterium]